MKWWDTFYLENFGLVAAFLVTLAVPLFFLQKSKPKFQASWASVKSWLLILPVLFFALGLPEPGPLVFSTLIGFYSAKRFFQMTGTYHKSPFVYVCYIGIALSSYFIYIGKNTYMLFSPLCILFVFSLLPVMLNHSKNMLQYISLSFICFMFYGFNLSLGSHMLSLEKGFYLLFYLYAMGEFAVNTSNIIGSFLPSPLVAEKVSSKTKWSGMIGSFILTIFLAWAFRRLSLKPDETFWVSAGLIAFFGSHFGEWTLSAFKKDLALKDQGVFIIGRGDILNRTHRVIFVFPFYALFLWSQGYLTL